VSVTLFCSVHASVLEGLKFVLLVKYDSVVSVINILGSYLKPVRITSAKLLDMYIIE
jgi:hypothetical protein